MSQTIGRGLHVNSATVDTLLQRLDGVQRVGKGWRARCPACGGGSRKVSIAVADDRVLLHCFGGCQGDEVLGAIGLRWADLHPPRAWPQSPEERRHARRAVREAGWAAALDTLALEATVVSIAARDVLTGAPLSPDDLDRLMAASERIDGAREVLRAR